MQAQERIRIEREKEMMEKELEALANVRETDQKTLLKQMEELKFREHQLELTKQAMEDKELEHQRQIEEQKQSFLQKERELQSQKTSKLAVHQMTREIKPLIDEANEIAKQLGQSVHFDFSLTASNNKTNSLNISRKNFEFEESKYNIDIKVNNLESEEQYIWDTAKFRDRLMVMRDMLATYEQQGELDATEENPFTDKQEPSLIGEGYYRLEPLAYLIDQPIQIGLIGSTYRSHGQLDVNIIPVDENGSDELPEELIPDAPEDLLNQRIDYLVTIEQAHNLP